MDELKFLCLLAIVCNILIGIGNLVFFTSESSHTTWIQSSIFEITIEQWLGITSIINLFYILSAIFTAIFSQCMQMKNNFVFLLWICYKVFHTLFQICWISILAFMHWGENLLDQETSNTNSSSSIKNQSYSSSNEVLKKYLTSVIIIQVAFCSLQWILWRIFLKRRSKQMKIKSQKSATLENSTKSQEETSNVELVSGTPQTRDHEDLKKQKISKKNRK